jgi:hypothetical protein
MVLEDFILDLFQSRLDRLNLGQDVNTIAVILDHADDAADLAFNSLQSRHDCANAVFNHLTDTSLGYR